MSSNNKYVEPNAKEAMKQFGTDSFPNEEQAHIERETKFAIGTNPIEV